MKPARAGIVLLLALLAVGIYAGVQQWIHGDAVTGLGTIGAGGVVWGLYVVGDGFFASVALAALAAACVIRVARARRLEPVAQLGGSLAVAGLLASVVCVLADLGRPLVAMINLPLVGRARAPFFGTFTLVVGAPLCAALVQLWLAARPAWAERRPKAQFWLSLALLPLACAGLAILAGVFATRTGRPLWLARLEVVTFLVSGGAAACSLLLLAVAARFPAQSRARASALLARILALLIALDTLLVISGEILGLSTPGLAMQRYTRALLVGQWHRLFWAELILLFAAAGLCLVKLWRGTASAAWALVVAGLLSAAVFIERFLLLVAWQTDGLSLPWPAGAYHATRIEWSLLLGIAAAAALVFLFLARACPAASPEPVGAPARAGWRRSLLTGTCLLLGLAAAATGLTLSSGFASAPFLDPIVPGGPLLFLGGLLLMLAGALVYELIPERAQRE